MNRLTGDGTSPGGHVALIRRAVANRQAELSMGLNRPSQNLRSDLQSMSCNGENLAIELLKIAEQTDDKTAFRLLRLLERIFVDADRLKALADEVRAGQIIRKRPEKP
ncbi:TPA: hypothetical protein NIC38_004012 [Pseudomonas aeruginosa]|uniref:hypothetical protein n=1 Tax=Pseudomonas aeruginosa TaxID=287 RepID=UPI0021AFD8ED|nr:hypothetical protein [Pseudomonas aeruginosa]HCF2499753.1 hypothetical protein [Pseudomonas aeruginosa]HCF2907310.1 hypothetical protein [Pseudomonas aeruginosa]HDQ4745385.1 hypothetical protein [Pseudomonas aeruginosa]